MLVLTRKQGEEVVIGNDIRIRVLEHRGGRVRLGISAPPAIHVARMEILERQSSDTFSDKQEQALKQDSTFSKRKVKHDVRKNNQTTKPR